MDLLIIFILLLQFVFFAVYGISIMILIYKRVKSSTAVNGRMLAWGRVITWTSIISMGPIVESIHDGIPLVILMAFAMVCYVAGSRLYIHSYTVNVENKGTFYYAWDRWLVNMYKKHLEPIGK